MRVTRSHRPSQKRKNTEKKEESKTLPVVYVVSDGRGETSMQVLKAAAVQFEGRRYRVVRKAGITSPEEVARAVDEAAKVRALVFYALVGEETRREMRRASARRLVPTVDVLGPAFAGLHDLLHVRRREIPGLLYALERERLDRMDAIDYTLRHDDGQRPHDLSRADVVLVGVSRAAKSATCFFLAYEGIRAANVPIVPGVPPPPQLFRMAKSKVVGLRVNVERLLTIRRARAQNLGLGRDDDYVDRRAVVREVLQANGLMEENGWRSIDVSYLAVEEIAREVLRLRRLEGGRPW